MKGKILLMTFALLALFFLSGCNEEQFNPDKDICLKTCSERETEISHSQYKYDLIYMRNCVNQTKIEHPLLEIENCYIWLEKDEYNYVKFYAKEMKSEICD